MTPREYYTALADHAAKTGRTCYRCAYLEVAVALLELYPIYAYAWWTWELVAMPAALGLITWLLGWWCDRAERIWRHAAETDRFEP